MAVAGARTCILNFATTENNEDIFETPALQLWLTQNFPNYKRHGIDAYITILANEEYASTIEFNNDGNNMVFIENLVYDTISPSYVKSIRASLPINGTIVIKAV